MDCDETEIEATKTIGSTDIEKAIERCKKFTTEHKLFNIKEADNLEDAIDIVLNELDNRIPKKDVEEILKKHKKAMKLAREQISEKIIIADSDSLNFGRKEAHNLIISDLIDLLKRSK